MGQVTCSSGVSGYRRVGSSVSPRGKSNSDTSKCVCVCARMCVLHGTVGITVIPRPRQDRDPEPKTREPVEQLRWDWAAICLSEHCSTERRTPTDPHKRVQTLHTHTHTHTHMLNTIPNTFSWWMSICGVACWKHSSLPASPELVGVLHLQQNLSESMNEWKNEWINLTEWNHRPCFCLHDGNLWQSTGNVKQLLKAIFIHTKKKKNRIVGGDGHRMEPCTISLLWKGLTPAPVRRKYTMNETQRAGRQIYKLFFHLYYYNSFSLRFVSQLSCHASAFFFLMGVMTDFRASVRTASTQC